MQVRNASLAIVATMAFGVGAAFLANASDHADSPTVSKDLPVDIADLYAWHDNGQIVAILSFAGLFDGTGTATFYDADVLYGIHIDNDGDQIPDHDIAIRFGQNGAGDWGVQVQGLPGGDPTMEGPVDVPLTDSTGLQAFAGIADDPFFMDFQGFVDTVATETLAFDATRDFFAGRNATVIAVTMDAVTADGGTGTFDIWATASRL